MPRSLTTLLSVILACCIGLHVLAAPITVSSARTLTEETRVNVSFFADAIVFLSDTSLAIGNLQNARTVLWDVSVGGSAGLVDAPQLGKVLGVSEDRARMVVGTRSGTISIWSIDPIEWLFDIRTLTNTPAPRAALSADGALLAVTNARDIIELWDLETLTQTGSLVGHDSNMFELAFSPDDSLLATAGGWSGSTTDADSCLKVWDVATGTLVISLPTIDIGDNHAISFANDGARLISGGNERLVVWDTDTWNRLYDFSSNYVGSSGLEISPNQQLLALAYWDQTIRIFDANNMRTLRSLSALTRPSNVAFSPDGSRLAASFDDGTIIVWATP